MAKRKVKGMAAELIASATGKTNEPKWDQLTTPTKIQLASALNFYNVNADEKVKQKYALAWIAKNAPEALDRAKKAPTYMFGGPVPSLMRMQSRGLIISAEHMEVIQKWVANIGPRAEETAEEKPKPVKIKKVVVDANMAILDDVLDAAIAGEKPVPVFEGDKPMTVVLAYLKEQLDVIKQDDKAYPKHMKAWFNDVLKRAQGVQVVTKTKRVMKPRVRKIDPVKMTKNVKYLKRCDDLKIDGLKPMNIIGKKKVYLFDTKYRRLTRLVSSSEQGFMFSGTSYQNIDLEKSVSKTLRKPADVLKAGMGIRELDRAFGLVKAKENSLTGQRSNDNLLIIQAS